MTSKKILTILAVVAFALATFGVTFAHFALIPCGLALYAARLLVE
jgi:Sec-independent protein secretion pathway component TatC